MSTTDAPLIFGAEGYRAVSLAAVFLKHVHEHDEAGMRAILDEVNSSATVSSFVAALAAVALGFARRLYSEEELGQALQDYAIRLDRESLDDHAQDSP